MEPPFYVIFLCNLCHAFYLKNYVICWPNMCDVWQNVVMLTNATIQDLLTPQLTGIGLHLLLTMVAKSTPPSHLTLIC